MKILWVSVTTIDWKHADHHHTGMKKSGFISEPLQVANPILMGCGAPSDCFDAPMRSVNRIIPLKT